MAKANEFEKSLKKIVKDVVNPRFDAIDKKIDAIDKKIDDGFGTISKKLDKLQKPPSSKS